MVPPSWHTEADYSELICAYQDLGYQVTFANRFPSACSAVGDDTDRERFLMVCSLDETVDFTSNLGPVQGSCRQFLDYSASTC